jgi:O-antigen ligase
MATMSIGAAILIAAIVLTSESTQGFFQELSACARIPEVKQYLIFSSLLATACAISLYWAETNPLRYGGRGCKIDFLKNMAKVWYLYWPWLLLVGLRRLHPKALSNLLIVWLFTFCVLSFIGVAQYWSGWPRPQPIPGNPGHYHVTLLLGHHLSVASILIFPFFALVECGVYQKIFLPKALQPLYWIATTVGCLALILTYSRILWIALPIGLIAWTVWTMRKKTKKAQIGILFFFVLILIGLVQVPSLNNRIRDTMGISERQELWKANLKFFTERPITGVGWRYNQELSGYYLMEKLHTTEVFAGHAHNNLLDMMGGTGALGALAWLLWCYWVIRILFTPKIHDYQPEFARSMTCAWLVFHINGLTQVNFWEAKVQHQISWVVAWSLCWIAKSHKIDLKTKNVKLPYF